MKYAIMTTQKRHFFVAFLGFSFLIFACTDTPKDTALPIIGERQGIAANGDTIYPTIPDFSFTNQNNETVTNKTFEGKIYVADFFFTHCPTICPKVTAQMLRLHEQFKDSAQLILLSHSIDPKRDTIGRLKEYASKLGVDAPKWHFVTGNKEAVYGIADDYFSVAQENPTLPGGFDHSGRLILIDKKRHVRAFCDGTDEKDVDRFMEDVKTLLRKN